MLRTCRSALLLPAIASALSPRAGWRVPAPAASRLCMMGGGFGTSTKDTFKYTGKMRPGKRSAARKVPKKIPKPDYALDGVPKARGGGLLPWQIEKKSEADIAGMRVAGRVAREVLDAAVRLVDVGVPTDEIDALVHAETLARGAYPSPLNYHGFPKSCCTSVNEVICHGIPDSYKLKDGDIVNIDVTCYFGGYHGDCSETVLVGDVDEAGRKLVRVTYEAWQAAITYCRPGQLYKGIGALIEDYIEPHGYASVQVFCGHGIGKVFHTSPNILHYRNNEPGKMEVGHVFTIEPMINEGTVSHIEWRDGWTATTKDGKRSAQFEHTLLVTPTGVEALTARLADSPPLTFL
uniref:Methionine aminopeptidase n=1 Tax=Calcidiscus leptoporus TaxID=127549 RepID=A0A7S0NTS3_9EUKA|mmetsp:Transcript_2541/g.5730  ORF Transcript_2541/g.5730 Transcript_2541/m.5730 type:complete len:349 (+) Transcript_2541:65-1111(+)